MHHTLAVFTLTGTFVPCSESNLDKGPFNDCLQVESHVYTPWLYSQASYWWTLGFEWP